MRRSPPSRGKRSRKTSSARPGHRVRAHASLRPEADRRAAPPAATRARPGRVRDLCGGVCFPNDRIERLKTTSRRRYAARFDSAAAVVRHVASHSPPRRPHPPLARHLVRFDPAALVPRSHFPQHLDPCHVDRPLVRDNRFYGWEGVGCCAGTCHARVALCPRARPALPQLERSLREITDYGVGFDAETGRIRFRAEHNEHWAVDGQAGSILRVYREHQMSVDDAFLRRLWPR